MTEKNSNATPPAKRETNTIAIAGSTEEDLNNKLRELNRKGFVLKAVAGANHQVFAFLERTRAVQVQVLDADLVDDEE